MRKISNKIFWGYLAFIAAIILGTLIFVKIKFGLLPINDPYNPDGTEFNTKKSLQQCFAIIVQGNTNITITDFYESSIQVNDPDLVTIGYNKDTLIITSEDKAAVKLACNKPAKIIATDKANVIFTDGLNDSIFVEAHKKANISFFSSDYQTLVLTADSAAEITFTSTNIDTLVLDLQGGSNVNYAGANSINLVKGKIGKHAKIFFSTNPLNVDVENKGQLIYSKF